ncbi:cobalt ECF transporter T component CbiQ [Janibacter terrae]|uniref:Cobalt ECF transporter T component CbiQ n=1 Tax=Janibacter terrae TaxID=103817 RepID=A0ABZ2FGE5_9MICO|nr:cobalt ECF transporter T component CbiQ [Janibacter terrae]MBA4083600.1 cobalt ECF transporter T component CbiQ [Kytococcus sp.]HBO55343.1 cobalt ECF transporter T component CbiQ [Janibacter terrae]
MRPTLDDAAWSSRWRSRSTLEKSLLCLGLLLVAATTTSLVVAGLVGVCAVGLAALARVPVGVWLRAMLGPAVFVGIGAVTIAVTLGPGDLWSLGPIGVGEGSVSRAVLVAARALAATSAMVLLAATTPMVDLLAGLRRARVPEVAVDIAAVTYRMIFALLDAASAIRAAQAGRLGYASGRAARRSVGQLCAAVLVAAWDKARRLEDGLAGRGGVAAVPLVPARSVSTPFVLAAGGLVLGLAGLSLRAGLA